MGRYVNYLLEGPICGNCILNRIILGSLKLLYYEPPPQQNKLTLSVANKRRTQFSHS